MILGFIRHTLTKMNEDDLACGGLSDPHLSPKGIGTVEELRDQGLYSDDPGILYASTLKRTKETLEIIYPGREIIESALLNEQKLGVIESLTKETAGEYFATHTDFITDPSYVPEGDAESVNQFHERVRRDFDLLYREFEDKGYDKVTICCHGNYFRAIVTLYDMRDDKLKSFEKIQVKNGTGVECEVNRNDNGFEMRLHGYLGGKDLDSISRSYDELLHRR